MRWHFLLTSPAAGPYNMALDEGLMLRAGRTGDAVFRVYGWSDPTLSLGRNQRARGCYDLDRARAMGVRFVRRPTGGRALLHHREITYSATMPIGDASAARAAYGFINGVLLNGLSRLGVAAERATATSAVTPGPRPCFDVPAEQEIVVGGRKLVGSAQWRRGGALLQHGSILIRDDQAIISRLLPDVSMPPSMAATLADVLGRDPEIDEVAALMHHSLGDATPAPIDWLDMDDELRCDLDRLSRTYEDSAWTWRR